MASFSASPVYYFDKNGLITVHNKENQYVDGDTVLCTIFINRLGNKPVILHLNIYHDFTFLNFITFLIDSYQSQLSSISFHESSFRIPRLKKSINLSNINEKLMDSTEENHVLGNKSIELVECGMLMPKNDFEKSKNIVGLYKHNLHMTRNIGTDKYSLDLINLSKTGSWDGFGSGPTGIMIDKEEDNHLRNLIFVIYNKEKPYAYNVHCLYKTVNHNEGSVLIPHLNKRFVSSVLKDIFYSDDEFKIVKLDDSLSI